MRLKYIFTLAVMASLSFTFVKGQQTAKISSARTGYLEYLPQNYNSNTNKYPIVIFLHGIGERGTTSSDPATLKSSVQKVANVGLAKYVKYGSQYPFILISPQLKSSYGTWPANYVMEVLNHVKKYLRVDDRRIYITGLSLGGFGAWTTLGAYPSVFAAAVPICSGGSALSKACAIAAQNVALWGFHGTSDNVVSYSVTTKMINAVNACTPRPSPLAKTTLFSGLRHVIWDKVYKETNAINWMLGFTNGATSSGSTTTNNPPVVSAGSDKTLKLPTNETYLQGSASDSDGSIAAYQWTKTYGGSASLSGTTTSKLRAYNLAKGTYTFRLTAKDNKGASKSDDVKVTVTETTTTTNVIPVANAGANRSITLPTNRITITGSGTDKGGKIVSYKWTKYSGPGATLTNATSPSVTLSNMVAGSYYLKLTVTDDRGASDSDNMLITVRKGTTTTTTYNASPVSNAGPNRLLASSTRSVKVYGSASDKDGKVVSYKWTKYSGADISLTNSTSPAVTLSGLREGKYYLKLTVKDDDGAVDSDNVLIVINES